MQVDRSTVARWESGRTTPQPLDAPAVGTAPARRRRWPQRLIDREADGRRGRPRCTRPRAAASGTDRSRRCRGPPRRI
ncbi:hypothetical protein ACWEL8_18315 [Streptomyces sp. NPDC004690]